MRKKKAKSRGSPGRTARGKYESHVLPRLEFVKSAARMGNSEEEIAKQLGVSYSTFREYKKKHPELQNALREGADDANGAVVNALHRRALGYTATIRKVFKLKKPIIEDGKKIAEEEVLETAEEDVHVPADTKAIIFWLTNRMGKDWRSSPDLSSLDAANKPNRELLEMIKADAPDIWDRIRADMKSDEKSQEVTEDAEVQPIQHETAGGA